jgi:hypothetical protein
LFANQPLDLQTISKLPERWMLAFFLLSLSAFFSLQRHVFWRVVYGHFVLITAALAAAVCLPVFTHGFGWLGLAQYSFGWRNLLHWQRIPAT